MHEEISNIKYAVITVSDSRFNDFLSGNKFEDKSGEFLKNELRAEIYFLIPDNKLMLKGLINHISEYCGVDCIVITGGTGLTKRDNTPEVLKEIYEKELEGFKIIFHKLSYDEVGFSTILSRASAGTYQEKIIFSLPGSLNACKTAVQIIKKETGHILGHLK
ncbi:molybdenum cofactor synthesis domain [Methanococcus vannielii SB]|jgi:molybdenum cofactor biosynthesis protein B|uniref:Molybdenum cofactor synthesis domain n=1 Tax=Methanococcus vannielii (strain ATCC 35089 / DSM 1224 / JCM 13029 / OCM 148 / SB) TaxID=406327 RepID=A6UQC8_METVS|nr:MogA/MoaB family molybdenum cofactor biosynthesis protein [Methanococcus vannielii]ABR54700.1 molybdenum cofactor synthesis domain [Methanococcus vannielii SB]